MFKYYVYRLIDPSDGKPFYVGKGCGDRINEHEKEARRGVKSRKCEKILAIRRTRKKIVKEKIAYFWNEQDAYDFETEVISEIGLENLTNVLPGGQKAWAEREELMRIRKRSSFLKSKHVHRCIAIWLLRKHGVIKEIDKETRPFGYVLNEVSQGFLSDLYKEMHKVLGFEGLRDAMRHYGIELVIPANRLVTENG